jgi:cyanate permease
MSDNQDKMDKFIKFVLVFAALYFLGHIGMALANDNPPIIRCIPAGNGTVTCFPI